MTHYLLDTGPWIAYGDASDQHHAWAKQLFRQITPPLFTCESVVAEMCFLAQRGGGQPQAIVGMVEIGIFQISFHLDEEIVRVCELMQRYRDVPMSLADACLVRMAECFSDSVDAPLVTEEDTREAYGEQRLKSLGWLKGRVVVVIWTERDVGGINVTVGVGQNVDFQGLTLTAEAHAEADCVDAEGWRIFCVEGRVSPSAKRHQRAFANTSAAHWFKL